MIERFEGGRSSDGFFHAYLDRVAVPNIWTIGFGQTNNVHEGMVWTLAQATSDLRNSLASSYEPHIWALGRDFNDNEFAAIASFIWNCGVGTLNDPVGHYLRIGDFHTAAQHMLLYVKAGGVTVPGLVTRRKAEVALLLTPVAKPDPNVIFPTSVGDKSLPNGGNERLTVLQAQGALKNPKKYHGYLKTVLYNYLKLYRDRLSRISLYEPSKYQKKRKKADWNTNSRGIRRAKINDLMEKIDKL